MECQIVVSVIENIKQEKKIDGMGRRERGERVCVHKCVAIQNELRKFSLVRR